jgi:hypothetical protein
VLVLVLVLQFAPENWETVKARPFQSQANIYLL